MLLGRILCAIMVYIQICTCTRHYYCLLLAIPITTTAAEATAEATAEAAAAGVAEG